MYSSYDVIGQELDVLEGNEKGFLRWLSKKLVFKSFTFSFEVPAAVFLRSKVFCDDIESVCEYVFNPEYLIDVLYDDFMENIKVYGNDIPRMYQMIKSRDQRLKLVSGQKEKVLNPERCVSIHCEISRKDALRLEFMLSEIDTIYSVHYMIEDVLSIIFCDFVYELQQGNLKQITRDLLKRFLENEGE